MPQTRIDSKLVLSAIGATVTLAGVLGVLAGDGTDTTEGKTAFWIFLTLFLVLLIYAAAPLYQPPYRSIRRLRRSWLQRRDMKREFPVWSRDWQELALLLTKVVRRRYGGRTNIPEAWEKRYGRIRRRLQSQTPGFVQELERAVSDNLMRTMTRRDQNAWYLDEAIAGSRRPFRLFYSESDLGALRDGLCPHLSDSYGGRDRDMETFQRTIERLDDIMLEFATEHELDSR